MKRIFLTLVLLIALLVVIYSVLEQMRPETGEPIINDITTTTEATYTNTVNNYSIKYPSNYEIIEYSPENVVVGNIEGDNVEGIAEVSVLNVEGIAGQNFGDVVTQRLIEMCAADGPRTTFSCIGTEQVQPFTSTNSVLGQVIYLTGELTNLETNESESIGKGPYFVFIRDTGATMTQAIVIHPPLNQTADEANSEVIRKIAESLVITNSTSTSSLVEEFIGQNISELSPIKEQLGGKFYVTSIQVSTSTGVVMYEDGHNAYTADFSFVIDESSMVNIASFVIREEE